MPYADPKRQAAATKAAQARRRARLAFASAQLARALDALRCIAATTTDPAARQIARDALGTAGAPDTNPPNAAR